jgi:hypothetical protein
MRLALTGDARPLDVGRANGTVFLMIAGMGADARMIRDADRTLKNRMGVLAYVVAGLRHLTDPRTHYTITVDGRRIERRARTVMVANVGRITGGVELVPGADPEDGLLEVAIVRARNLWDLGLLAWSALRGQRPRNRAMEIHRGRTIRIETPLPQPVQLDGNEAPSTRCLEVTVEPGALQLVRAPDDARPTGPLAALPIVLGFRRTRIAAWSLLAGAATTLVVHLRARVAPLGNRRSFRFLRRPIPSGLLTGVLTWLALRRHPIGLPPDSGPPESPAGEDE